MPADDEGILGNLPRSRPGQRSSRRKPVSGAAAPRPQRPRRDPSSAITGTSGAADSRPDGLDPPSGALRAAGQVAQGGIKVASRLASGALSRLPGR